jgi:DNA-binding IclR family transcriptional regulator
MGTHRAGVYRLLRPLQAAELVERRADGTFVLGVGLVGLAANVRSSLQEMAAAQIQKLANELRATCALTIRSGDEAMVMLVQEPLNSHVHIAYRPGLRHPLTKAASGLAILAGGPAVPDERREVKRARKVGYAVTRGELFPGATGLGAPIFGTDGVCIASLSVVWLGDEADLDQAATSLRAAADEITAALSQDAAKGPTRPLT